MEKKLFKTEEEYREHLIGTRTSKNQTPNSKKVEADCQNVLNIGNHGTYEDFGFNQKTIKKSPITEISEI